MDEFDKEYNASFGISPNWGPIEEFVADFPSSPKETRFLNNLTISSILISQSFWTIFWGSRPMEKIRWRRKRRETTKCRKSKRYDDEISVIFPSFDKIIFYKEQNGWNQDA